VLGLAAPAAADAVRDDLGGPERRRAQFSKEFGYGVFPVPYRLPGIGSGLSLAAGALNIADSHTDVYGIAFGGDVKGGAIGVGDLHLLPRRLILDLGYSAIDKATFQSYSQRGMSSAKDDYRLIEVGDTEYFGGRLTGTFFERRLEFYGAWYQGASRLKSIRDKNGDLIVEAQDPPRNSGHTTIFGARVDLTDDYSDPRRGLRVDVSRSSSPPRGSGADYYVMDYSTTGYLPLGSRNTLAINFLRSDAHVRREGVTDRAELEQQLGLDCGSIGDPTQRSFCDDVIDNTIASNRFGTATGLGGFNRLRSYPQGRFQGAHTMFLGAELRWNITEERRPFDIWLMRDIRTGVQIALFYETGATSDSRSDLDSWDNYRQSYGTGLRLVFASGLVLRADIAHGDDGFNLAAFVGYPWEL
jgi:outer membrane protein assembly factor BamA